MSKAMQMLASRNRWCVTGTPFTMDQTDLCNQLKFLGLQTCNTLNKFRENFQLQTRELLDLCTTMMRHTKAQKRDGKPILELGKMDCVKMSVPFTSEEDVQYKKLFSTAKNQYNALVARGITRGIEVMSLLAPLRLACSGAGSLDIGSILHRKKKKT